MPLWSFWLSGLALASVPVMHWLGLGRALGVSGHYTALINRLRFGRQETLDGVDEAALIAALQAATADEFGESGVDGQVTDAVLGAQHEQVEAAAAAHQPLPAPPRAWEPADNLIFLVGLGLGGLVSGLLFGELAPAFTLQGARFAELFGPAGSPLQLGVLFVGGLCVGWGTRMAGGCTSGHGLCGLSQFQPGSFVATAAFFGAGVATSFLLDLL